MLDFNKDTKDINKDFNKDTAREPVVTVVTAASESFSPVFASTIGLLPIDQDPASSSSMIVTASNSALSRCQDKPGHVQRSNIKS